MLDRRTPLVATLFLVAFLFSSGVCGAMIGAGPIIFHLSLKPHAGIDPAVSIAMENTSDDDYGLNPAQWLIVQKVNTK
jgi:hypothetical protein